MEKISVYFIALLISFTANLAFANTLSVGKQIIVNGQIVNDSPLCFLRDLVFTTYNTDIYVKKYYRNLHQEPLIIEIPSNDEGDFYLNYSYRQGAPSDEKLCKFHMRAINSKDVNLSVETLPDSFITCSLVGSPKNHLILHITFNKNVYKNLLIAGAAYNENR